MITKQLAPYILISILIHAGLVVGMQVFLNWSTTVKGVPETLVPVEIVVMPEASEFSNLKLTADRWVTDETGLSAHGRMMTATESGSFKTEPVDPAPLLNDSQPEVILDRSVPPNPTGVTQAETAPARLTGVASSGKFFRQQFQTDEQMPGVSPVPAEHAGEPKIRSGSSPGLTLIRVESRELETSGDAAIPAYQSVAADISDAEVLPWPGSVEPAVQPATDLRETEARPRSHPHQLPRRAAASPSETLSSDRAISELRLLPKAVSVEPRMMVATLRLNSEPGGAQVFIDDLPSGETPLNMEIPVGKHEFRLVLPNHYDWKAQIELTERNRPYPISPRLLPIK